MPNNDITVLDTLTAKQREVLDLLMEHKTSKEIARELGISPHTVDQRIQFSKEKLGVGSRSEVAVEYRRLIQLCQSPIQPAPEPSVQDTYEDSGSAERAVLPDLAVQRDGSDRIALRPSKEGNPGSQAGEGSGHRVVPGMFEGRYGTLMRLGVIVLITTLLLLIVLGGLALFDNLSRAFAA